MSLQELKLQHPRGWFAIKKRRWSAIHCAKVSDLRISAGVLGSAGTLDGSFEHRYPTEMGSSGAPILDITLSLVSLHVGMRRAKNNDHEWMNFALRADWIARNLAKSGIELVPPPTRR